MTATAGPADPMLRRVERRAMVLAVGATMVALFVPGGGVRIAAGVAGGAILALGSYWAIRRGIDGMADRLMASVAASSPPSPTPATPALPGDEAALPVPAADGIPAEPLERRSPPRGLPRGLMMFVFRHALLAGIAYVMIARLRLPPLALLGGASVLVLAVAGEAVRRPARS